MAAGRKQQIFGLRNRRLAFGLGVTAAIHLALLLIFAVSTTQTIVATPLSNPAFRVTLVRNPLTKTRARAKTTAHDVVATRRAASAHLAPQHAAPIDIPIPSPQPVAPATSSAPGTNGSEADLNARARNALRGLAACHGFGAPRTDKERRDCEDRLGRLAENAPTIKSPPPPPQDDKAELKLGTCRMNLRKVLSARVKCKF